MSEFLEELLAGKKTEKDFRVLQEKIRQNPKNTHLLVKLGDLLAKKGKRAEALEAYRRASEGFGRSGFLVQAIAVNKMILRLDPSQEAIQERLAALYAEKGMPGGTEAGAGPVLPVTPLFSDFKKEELTRLLPKILVRFFPAGEIVFREGDRGDSLFVVGRGRVRVLRDFPGKGRTVLAELREGEFFGEFAFFARSPRTATVEALAESEILEIRREDLAEIVREFPGVSRVLESFYKDRVADGLVAASPLFASLSAPERKNLLRRLVTEEFPAGTLILREGEPGDSLYLIQKGEAEVFTRGLQGEILPLARLREGDFFGEIALITGRPRTASVKTVSAAEVHRLPGVDFRQILKARPEMLSALEESLRYRLGKKLAALGVFRNSPEKERIL